MNGKSKSPLVRDSPSPPAGGIQVGVARLHYTAWSFVLRQVPGRASIMPTSIVILRRAQENFVNSSFLFRVRPPTLGRESCMTAPHVRDNGVYPITPVSRAFYNSPAPHMKILLQSWRKRNFPTLPEVLFASFCNTRGNTVRRMGQSLSDRVVAAVRKNAYVGSTSTSYSGSGVPGRSRARNYVVHHQAGFPPPPEVCDCHLLTPWRREQRTPPATAFLVGQGCRWRAR